MNDIETLKSILPDAGSLAFCVFVLVAAFVHYRVKAQRFKKNLETIENELQCRNEAYAEMRVRERAALDSARLKSQFLANMSHEIRTPIHGVLGSTNILLDMHMDQDARKYVEAITESSQNLLKIINDILDVSKIEAGKIEIETVVFNLKDTMQSTLTALETLALNKGIQLSINHSLNEQELLLGDSGRIQQILMNLMGNAIKFTENGFVRVSTQSEEITDGRVLIRFEIRDSGIGMSQQDMEHIFTEFTQADRSTTRRFGGTGLGLSICKHLIERMGGTIGVESIVGLGSKFWFTLNLKKSNKIPSKTSVVRETRPKVVANAISVSVLVVEDTYINQIIAQKILEKGGFAVKVVSNGQEAIDELKAKTHSVVLMDCHMPVLDGYQTTTLIRSFRETYFKELPIIAMTSNAMSEERDKCIRIGMTDYISKPFHEHDLLAIVSKWCAFGRGAVDQSDSSDSNINHQLLSEIFHQHCGSSRSEFQSIRGIYLLEGQKYIDSISRDIDKADSRELKVAAHSLASTSRYFGAIRLSELADTVEQIKDLPTEFKEMFVRALQDEFLAVERTLLHEQFLTVA